MPDRDCLLRCYRNCFPVIAEERLSTPLANPFWNTSSLPIYTSGLWIFETMLPHASWASGGEKVIGEHCLGRPSVPPPWHLLSGERQQRDLSALKLLLSECFISATETAAGQDWVWPRAERWDGSDRKSTCYTSVRMWVQIPGCHVKSCNSSAVGVTMTGSRDL